MHVRILLSWILLVCAITWVSADLKNLHVQFQWKYIDYNFPSEEARQEALSSGRQNPFNSLMVDADTDRESNRTFVTVVGMKADIMVPATLCTVTNKMGEGGPLLEPYPNWQWHDHSQDCNGKLINVYRILIDKCRHLWVLDSGVVAYPVIRVCPPKILAFDLKTDKLVKRARIPQKIFRDPTLGIGVVETMIATLFGPKCDAGVIYLIDPYGHGLGVYNGMVPKGAMHRLRLSPFDDDPKYADIVIANESMSMKGIGLYASTVGSGRFFFSSITSVDLHETAEINLWLAHYPDHPVEYSSYPNLFPSPISVLTAVEEHEILFFGLTTDTAIGVWNYRHKNKIEIVEQDSKTLQHICNMKVIRQKGEELELMLISNRFQKYLANTVDINEVNFRIMTGRVNKLLNGTKAGSILLCEKHSSEDKVKEICQSEDARVAYKPEDLLEEENMNYSETDIDF